MPSPSDALSKAAGTGRLDRQVSSARNDAAQVADDLQGIGRCIQDSITAEAQRLRVPLTLPQLTALRILVDEHRLSGQGLSLSQLSKRMALAHSTVSGIIARLETRSLVRKRSAQNDRRFVSIELTPAVKQWLVDELPASRLDLLERALATADDDERRRILDGLALLRRRLQALA
jgi:DNA-binding MarR family transcriptional regulator